MNKIDKLKNVIQNLKNEIAQIKVLKINLESSNIKTFWEKTLEKFKNDSRLIVYYRKDKIDVLNKFCLAYDTIDFYGYKKREWLEFNVFTPDNLKSEIIKILPYKEEYLEKSVKTLAHLKSIESRYKKIIELKKINNYHNYNSSMLNIIKDDLKDSHYINN